MTVSVTTRLMVAVLTWAQATGRVVENDDARSWDEWPDSHESKGVDAMHRKGRYNEISISLFNEWSEATEKETEWFEGCSPRTGKYTALTLEESNVCV